MVSFPPVSPPRPYTSPSPHPYAPHAQPISFFSILSPAQYWVRSTNHLAPRYTIPSIPPLTLLVNYPVNVYNLSATCLGPSRPLSGTTTYITSHADAILHVVTTMVHLNTKPVHNTLWQNPLYVVTADPGGRAVYSVGLRPLACWDFGFESLRGMNVCLL